MEREEELRERVIKVIFWIRPTQELPELLGEIILMLSLILQFSSLVPWASKIFSLQQIFAWECYVNSERLWIPTVRCVLGLVKALKAGPATP